MEKLEVEFSPRALARVGGALYLVTILLPRKMIHEPTRNEMFFVHFV